MITTIDNFSGNIFNGMDPFSVEYIDTSIGSTIESKTIDDIQVSKKIGEKTVTDNIIDIRPLHLFFSKSWTTEQYNSYINDTKDKFSSLICKIVFCQSWDQLSTTIRDSSVKSICFCPDVFGYTPKAYEVVNMVNTLVKLLDKPSIKISVVAFKNILDVKTVKELQKSGIDCMLPSSKDFGWEELEKGLNAMWAGIPYWPKHIIEQLPGAKKSALKNKPDEIKLTARQSQILHLIKDRGASNKVIAKHLNITESTVKLHVSIVLKKFNVKNRTQLALFSA